LISRRYRQRWKETLMHNEVVRVCAAISVLALARALVAVPAHAGVVKTTAMVTGNPVTGTSGTITG
jgi:hypothetical protein